MSKFTRVNPVDPASHPLFMRLFGEMGFKPLSEEGIDEFLAEEGLKFVIFADDPNVQKETLDIVVIGPELRKAFGNAVADSRMADVMKGRAMAARWGVRKLPAVALFRNAVFLGASQGLNSWEGYLSELAEIAQRSEGPKRTISILAAKKHEE